MSPRIQPNADVAQDAQIGDGSSIWHLAQVREQAVLGRNCIIGRGAYVGTGVVMGDNCKLQNYALVYEPARLEDGVFVGPAVVFTNDHYPRAISPDGTLKRGEDWEAVGVTCRRGASIGARSVCVAPVTIGAWALVAAGSTVVKDVPDYALVAGSPAKRIGWVGRAGVPLESLSKGRWRCPQTGETYVEVEGKLARQEDAEAVKAASQEEREERRKAEKSDKAGKPGKESSGKPGKDAAGTVETSEQE